MSGKKKLLVLWSGFLLACGTLPFDSAGLPTVNSEPSSAISQTPLPAATPLPTATPKAAIASDQLSVNIAEPAEGQSSRLEEQLSPAASAEADPTFGEITFALSITQDYEPINSGLFFTHGITQVHAIFNYSHMSPEYTWERVWYLNDREVARVVETWTAPESGVFDYFIDNSGRPLPPGDWVLELYVEGKLRALGVFVIEAGEEAISENGQRVYQLVYTKCDGDHHNIYVADTNGHNEHLIVTRGAGPSWTPSGDAIFFFGEEGVDRQKRDGLEYVFDGLSNGLVALNAAPLPVSINQLNLFQNVEWKQATARWANVSPDGSMVAFDARPGGDYRIYFLGTDQNQQFRFELPGEQADWSPDSQKIVYRSGRDGRTGLWISNRDDSGHLQLTDNGSDSFPTWSPDGQTIAFSRDEGGNVDIYTINLNDNSLRRLTTTPGHDSLPTYAPNGDIIFRSARTGSWGIWKMKGDGSNQSEIIANACVGNDWAFSRMDVLP
jgi:TolB protein